MMERIKQFMARAPERGASLVEYALLVALIAVVCIAAVTKLGSGTSDANQDAADGLGGGEPVSNCWDGSHQGSGGMTRYGGASYLELTNTCYDDDDGHSIGPAYH